jgi:hypothetical protein
MKAANNPSSISGEVRAVAKLEKEAGKMVLDQSVCFLQRWLRVGFGIWYVTCRENYAKNLALT